MLHACSSAVLAGTERIAPEELKLTEKLSNRLGNKVWLKREDKQPVHSFKLRGAYNKMSRLTPAELERGVVCSSAGNHAQGVALSVRQLGCQAHIVMPVTTPELKSDAVRALGAQVILFGDSYSDAYLHALELQKKHQYVFVHPFDDPDVIEGQASVAVELLAQMPEPVDMVILPVGGGGLSAGVVSALSEMRPETEFRFVEPAGGQSLNAALNAGRPVKLNSADSFVDGAAVAKIGEAPFSVLRNIDPSQVIAVPEDRLCTTILEMLNVEGIVLEPAGALSVDALKDIQDELEDLVGMFSEVTGLPRVRFKVPAKLMASVTGLYAGSLAKVFPKIPQRLTPGAIGVLQMRRHADTRKAQEELGFRPSNVRDAVRDAFVFFAREGKLPDAVRDHVLAEHAEASDASAVAAVSAAAQ